MHACPPQDNKMRTVTAAARISGADFYNTAVDNGDYMSPRGSASVTRTGYKCYPWPLYLTHPASAVVVDGCLVRLTMKYDAMSQCHVHAPCKTPMSQVLQPCNSHVDASSVVHVGE